jgi:DNA-binding MarR family transcriptional regulator
MNQLSPALRDMYVLAFTRSLSTVFVVATAVALLGFLLTWLIPERPLRQTVAAASGSDGVGEVGEAFGMPTDSGSETYALRGLAALADRDLQRKHIVQITQKAGVDLTPVAASLLVRIDSEPGVPPESLGRTRGFGADEVRVAVAELHDRGLIMEERSDGADRRWTLTRQGCETLTRLVAARRAHLTELFADWSPGRREQIAAMLHRIADELVPDVRTQLRA